MKKGTRVRITHKVYGEYWYPNKIGEVVYYPGMNWPPTQKPIEGERVIFRKKLEEPMEGIVLGINSLPVGKIDWDEDYDGYEYPIFSTYSRLRVIMVEETGTQQYRKPIACLEEDLEVLDENS